MAVLVVGRTLLRVGQDFVGFLGFLEVLLGLRVVRVAVRMVLHGQLAVGLLDLGLAGVAVDAAQEDQKRIVLFLPHRADPTQSHADELKSSGLKATLPRIKILEIFQRSTAERGVRHMSAEDVYKALLAEGAEVGLATVYRVLTQFEQAGILARNHFETGKAVFELNEGDHHDHLVCLDCGRVEEFCDPEIEKRQQKIAEPNTPGIDCVSPRSIRFMSACA